MRFSVLLLLLTRLGRSLFFFAVLDLMARTLVFLATAAVLGRLSLVSGMAVACTPPSELLARGTLEARLEAGSGCWWPGLKSRLGGDTCIMPW